MTKKAFNSKIIIYNKKRLRKEILNQLTSQRSEGLLEKSSIIRKKLFESEEFKRAKCVVAYVSMPTEVDTHEIIDESIRMNKVVGVPVLNKGSMDLIISQISDRIRQLELGPYGIKQPRKEEIKPIDLEKIDLVLVPGLAFDAAGNRLGRGKGYYDRFLKKLPKNAFTVGLCFDFQTAGSIPALPHDIPVRMLLTN